VAIEPMVSVLTGAPAELVMQALSLSWLPSQAGSSDDQPSRLEAAMHRVLVRAARFEEYVCTCCEMMWFARRIYIRELHQHSLCPLRRCCFHLHFHSCIVMLNTSVPSAAVRGPPAVGVPPTSLSQTISQRAARLRRAVHAALRPLQLGPRRRMWRSGSCCSALRMRCRC